MGFYGTAKSAIKTNMQIDRHYSSRADMEYTLTQGDGIYAGRYVMIEYGMVQPQDLTVFYEKVASNGNTSYYRTVEDLKTGANPLTADDVLDGVMYRVAKNYQIGAIEPTFEIYIGNKLQAPYIRKASDRDLDNPYLANYLKDKAQWPEMGKGYDSTVWQKIYDNGTPKYINVADLNSVVPTFGIKVDAPSEIPKAPHFDSNLTNVYYDLHLQPAWGFRIKEAGPGEGSDITIKRYAVGEDNSVSHSPVDSVSGAIYFNKAGFDKSKASKIENVENKITVTPGKSGLKYVSQHAVGEPNSVQQTKQNDIQELSIQLPAIGNMMSEAWDIIHGSARDDSPVDSLQGRIDFFRNKLNANTIPVQTEGQYLIGATITDDDWITTDINSTNKTITIEHAFTSQNDTKTTADKNTDDSTCDGVNSGKGDELVLYTPIVDGKGHVVGENLETVILPYGFKTIHFTNNGQISTNGTGNPATDLIANNTQDDLTFKGANQWIVIGGSDDKDAGSVVHVWHQVNTINNTKKSDTDLNSIGEFTVQDLTFDAAGHVTANQEHKYTLPYSFKSVAIGSASTSVSEGSSSHGEIEADSYNDILTISPDNRWVTLSVDTANDAIAIGHASAGAEKTTVGDTTAATPAFGADFTVPYIKYDEMGHIVSNGTRKVTIPEGSLVDEALSGATTANVLTSIGFTPSTGEITTTHSNVGSLLLTGHSAINTDSSYIQPTDSIQAAFGKIDTRLDNEITRAKKAESDNATAIAAEKTRAEGAETTLSNTINTTASAIRSEFAAADTQIRADFVAADTAVQATVSAEETRAKAAEQALNDRITNLIGGDISADQLNTFKELSQALNDDTSFATTVNNAIAQKANSADVYTKIEVDNLLLLEVTSGEETISGAPADILTTLLARIQALEAHHATEATE